jgi:hypothetical protein
MENEGFSGLSAFLARQGLSDGDRAKWGAIHPKLMGGEYLPDLKNEEVEIARISLASTTGDQISVRATRSEGAIYYSVVDEYETEFALQISHSAAPLTLAELVALLDGTQHPGDIASDGLVKSHWNFMESEGESLKDAIGFVRVESGFYPGLSSYYAEEAQTWLNERLADREADDDADEM